VEGRTLTIPCAEVTKFEVCTGHTRHTLTGALVGYFIKSDKWSETPLSGATLGLVPLRDGGIQVALTWKMQF